MKSFVASDKNFCLCQMIEFFLARGSSDTGLVTTVPSATSVSVSFSGRSEITISFLEIYYLRWLVKVFPK